MVALEKQVKSQLSHLGVFDVQRRAVDYYFSLKYKQKLVKDRRGYVVRRFYEIEDSSMAIDRGSQQKL